MKFKNILFVALSFVLVTVVSCEKEKVKGCTDKHALNYSSEAEEDDGSCEYDSTDTSGCQMTKSELIDSVGSAPDSVSVGDSVVVDVHFGISSGCGYFDYFHVAEDGMARNVQVVNSYSGCICTDIYQIVTEQYVFVPADTGDYRLNFNCHNSDWSGDSIITRNVRVD